MEKVLSLDKNIVKQFSKQEIKMLYIAWKKSLNAPLTSSIGRLFDAVASLANLVHIQSYEGETGLAIEQNYDKNIVDSFDFEIIDKQIDLTLMIKQIIEENDIKVICSKFINTLLKVILEISKKHKKLPLVLSGGVFQNKTLLELLCKKLDKSEIKYFYSKKIPLNDGGISIGQIYYLS